MGSRSLASAAKAHIPKLRRLCSPCSRIQSTSCALQNRIPLPDHFIMKKDLEAEKALHTGISFMFLEMMAQNTNSPLLSQRYSLDLGVFAMVFLFILTLGNMLYGTQKQMRLRPSLAKVYPPGVGISSVFNDIWFDNKSQDYKVIQVSHLLFDDRRIGSRCVIDLYSLRTGSWKKKSISYVHCPFACINGVFYANAHKDSIGGVILSFDLSTRAFSYLPKPPQHNDDYPPMSYILDYNGLLSVLSCFTFRTAADALFEHWVMRNGSWHRLSVYRTRNVVRPCFSNGESLFFNAKNKLVVFDSSTQKMKHVDGIDSSTHVLFTLLPFSESSVKLTVGGGSHFQEEEHEEEEEDGHMIVTTDGPLMS